MRVILFCDNHEPLPPLFAATREFATLPLLTKPLAWRLAEQCVSAGAVHCTFVAANHPSGLRSLLGHGERWGITIDVATPVGGFAATLRALLSTLPPEEKTLVFPACWLCPPDALKALMAAAAGAAISLASPPPGGAPYVCASHAPQSPLAALTPDACGYAARLRSAGDVVRASMAALNGELPWLTREEKERAPGIAVGHHATIHPSAVLKPPVVVGAYASIDAQCAVGPHAVIGERSVLDREAELCRSVVDEATYVGAMTYHEDMLLTGRMVMHAVRGTCVLMPDAALQDALESPTRGGALRRACHRAVGGVLAALCAPFLLALWLWGGGFARRAVRGREESASLDCFQTPTLLRIREARRGSGPLRRLPEILDVAEGRLALVGPEPLIPDAADQLTQDWQRLRFAVTPGFFPPWAGLADAPLSPEEKNGINAWYARNATLGTDGLVLAGLLRRGWRHGKADSKA